MQINIPDQKNAIYNTGRNTHNRIVACKVLLFILSFDSFHTRWFLGTRLVCEKKIQDEFQNPEKRFLLFFWLFFWFCIEYLIVMKFED